MFDVLLCISNVTSESDNSSLITEEVRVHYTTMGGPPDEVIILTILLGIINGNTPCYKQTEMDENTISSIQITTYNFLY